jgi:hypothetical protein
MQQYQSASSRVKYDFLTPTAQLQQGQKHDQYEK